MNENLNNEFDARAKDWDKNNIHHLRSVAIAERMQRMMPLDQTMTALEYGAGTGILSFLLCDQFSKITLMDNSEGMIDVCKGKIAQYKVNNIQALVHDLEKQEYAGAVDVIYSQMVLHHVENVVFMINQMYGILNVSGWLSISDLYEEDGTFHEAGAKVHPGFNPADLKHLLEKCGFSNIKYEPCFEMKKDNGKIYPVFILVAQKQ
jgi:tRNA (cmo5U34)-methyltransferase